MKRPRLGLFSFGLVLLLLQVFSLAGQLKGGQSILPQPSGPLGTIHPYDLGVFLVSMLPGIIGAILVIASFVRPKRTASSEAEQGGARTAEGQESDRVSSGGIRHLLEQKAPAWSVVLLVAALAAAVGIVFWQHYYLPIQFAENTASLIEETAQSAREEGWDAGYTEGWDAGYDCGQEDGYAEGMALHAAEVYFFRSGACIVTTAGDKYHHWGCYHIGDSSYWIYNVELAEAKGYTPCLDCWEQGLDDLPLPSLAQRRAW